MNGIAMSIDRFDLYEMVGRSSNVAAFQHVGNRAGADVASLIAAGEIERAAGAPMVMVATMLLRAAAPAGGEGVPAATDLAIKARTAEKLNEGGATVAAAMVRGALAFERGAEAAAPSPSGARS